MKKIIVGREQIEILSTLCKRAGLSLTQYLNTLILDLAPNVGTGETNDNKNRS